VAAVAAGAVRADQWRVCDEICVRVCDADSAQAVDVGQLLRQPKVERLPADTQQVVPRASAVVPGSADGEPIAIHADHVDMVKSESRADGGYKTVSDHLQVMAGRANNIVGQQWDTEGRVDAGMWTWTGGQKSTSSSSSNEALAVRSNGPVVSFTVQFSVAEASHVDRFVGWEEAELDAIYQELRYDWTRKSAVVHGQVECVRHSWR
jgi:hypothetical protein